MLSIFLSIAAVLISIITPMYNLFNFDKTNDVHRAKFFKEIMEKLRFDKDMIDALNAIDYGDDWYNDDFPRSELEIKVDKVFSYLSYVCYLYKEKVIHKNEFDLFEYKIKRVCQNKSSQNYLKFLYHFSRKCGIEKHTYNDLMEYMFENVFNNDEKLINNFKNDDNFAIKRDRHVMGLDSKKM